jgi:hypothetical protein
MPSHTHHLWRLAQDNDGKERSKTPKDKSLDDDNTFFVER